MGPRAVAESCFQLPSSLECFDPQTEGSILRTSAQPEELKYPEKPWGKKGTAKKVYCGETYYFDGPHGSPESVEQFNIWKEMTVESGGDAPTIADVRAVMSRAIITFDKPEESVALGKNWVWVAVPVVVSVILGVFLLLAAQTVATSRASIDGQVISEEEIAYLRALRNARERVRVRIAEPERASATAMTSLSLQVMTTEERKQFEATRAEKGHLAAVREMITR